MLRTRDFLTPLRAQILLVSLLALHAAYVLFTGVDWIREDWESLYFVAQGDWRTAWPDSHLVRPPKVLLYELTYRTFGNHPVVAVVYLNVCLVLATLLVFRLLRTHLSLLLTTALLTFWAIVPTHLSLLRWPSVVHANTALVLTALALLCLQHRRRVAFGILAILAILTYEAVAVILVIAPLWFLRHQVRFRQPRSLLPLAATALGPILAFLYISLTAANTRPMAAMDYRFFARSVFAFGLEERWAWIAVAFPAALLTAFFLARLLRHGHPRSVYDHLLVGGILVAIFGALPFALNGTESVFTGLGDRATLISGFGTSALWIGLFGSTIRFLHRDPQRMLFPLVALVGILLIPQTLRIHSDYQHLNRTTQLIVEQALANPQSPLPTSEDRRIRRLLVVPEDELRLRALATCAMRQMDCAPRVFERYSTSSESSTDARADQ